MTIKRSEVLAHLGNRCCRCGETDARVLQIDHRFSDGAAERKIIGNNTQKLYKLVLEDVAGRYQILCASCQWRKRHEANECHKRPSAPQKKKTLKLLLRIRQKLLEKIG